MLISERDPRGRSAGGGAPPEQEMAPLSQKSQWNYKSDTNRQHCAMHDAQVWQFSDFEVQIILQPWNATPLSLARLCSLSPEAKLLLRFGGRGQSEASLR
jgi:hypothetical protein